MLLWRFDIFRLSLEVKARNATLRCNSVIQIRTSLQEPFSIMPVAAKAAKFLKHCANFVMFFAKNL